MNITAEPNDGLTIENPNLFQVENSENFLLEAEDVFVDDLLDVELRRLDRLEESCQLLLERLVELNNLDLLVVLTPGEPTQDWLH